MMPKYLLIPQRLHLVKFFCNAGRNCLYTAFVQVVKIVSEFHDFKHGYLTEFFSIFTSARDALPLFGHLMTGRLHLNRRGRLSFVRHERGPSHIKTQGLSESFQHRGFEFELRRFTLLFSVENFFRKENIQFSSRSFLPFPETAHDAQTYARAYCRTVCALNHIVFRKSEKFMNQLKIIITDVNNRIFFQF